MKPICTSTLSPLLSSFPPQCSAQAVKCSCFQKNVSFRTFKTPHLSSPSWFASVGMVLLKNFTFQTPHSPPLVTISRLISPCDVYDPSTSSCLNLLIFQYHLQEKEPSHSPDVIPERRNLSEKCS